MDPAAASGSVVCRVAPASQVIATANMVLRDLTIDGNKNTWGPDSHHKGYGYYLGQGMTSGTAYWFDIAVDTSNPTNAAFIQNVSVSITELAN